MTARALMLWGACLVLGACRVDGGYLDDERFDCAGPSDCGSGWGCVQASPYASDFCAPDCSELSGCDGICTVQSDGRALCLRGCRLLADGTTSPCQSEDFECVRSSAETDEGICYPVETCRGSDECADGEICLSELVGLSPSDPDSAGYYCVPQPDEVGACPSRSQPVTLGPGADLCLATCDPPDTRCPPGFGCLLQSAVFSEDEVLCFPGLYGVPCDDDTNCIFGTCLDAGGAGKQCSLSCDEAARLVGGCGNLFSLGTVIDALSLECDPTANGGAGGGLCVVHSDVGFICTTPESDAYRCAEGLDCRTFPTTDGEVRFCTRDCRIDQQCNDPGSDSNYCLLGVGDGGICFPKGSDGARCLEDNECESGLCRDVCVSTS